MSTNVPQYKTSIGIIIQSFLPVISCLDPERELAFAQWKSAYMERAQESDYMKKYQPSSSFPGQDMTVQTW